MFQILFAQNWLDLVPGIPCRVFQTTLRRTRATSDVDDSGSRSSSYFMLFGDPGFSAKMGTNSWILVFQC